MGGKSSSSNSTASTQTTTTTTGSATGTVGSVYQGQTVNITDQFPQQAVDVFHELIQLSGQAIDIAAQAGDKALTATNQLATSVKQPDIAVTQGYQKTARYAVIAAGVAGVAFLLRKA